MLWAFRHFLFSHNAPGLFFKRLSLPDGPLTPETGGTGAEEFAISRIDRIDGTFERRFNDVLAELDYAAPFTLSEADRRLGRGEQFIVACRGDAIAGWGWFAVDRVFCADFNCAIQIPRGQAYAYNIFVSRRLRRRGLATRLLTAAEPCLAPLGVFANWALIYDWNVASQKAFMKAGYERIGRYSILTVLGFRIRRCPELVQ